MKPRRIRAWIAQQFGKLPGVCWTDTVIWSIYGGASGHPWWKPYRPVTEACRRDAARCGVCFCGALKDPEGNKNWEAHLAEVDLRLAAEDGGAS